MEARKDSLSSIKLCRFCLAQGDSLTSIYEKRSTKNTINLSLKILSCVSVEVFPSDKMPTYICSRCKFFMELSYDFKNFCRQADEHILQFIQNATPITPMNWPQSLLKVFRLANKAPEVPLMKTVIEGGTTVQVTAQESDTDEEDDENVYNVKIGDGSDDGSKSARIKVVTGADNDKGKSKRGKVNSGAGKPDGYYAKLELREPNPELRKVYKKAMKMAAASRQRFLHQCSYCTLRFSKVQKLERHVQTHSDERSFPCKYCNKSFVKANHLTRHLRQKHRENIRTCRGPFGESDQYRCEQCEDSFATQDDLIFHSAIHATQNLTCPLCQEKFEDVDAVTAHIKSHVNGTEFMCDLCELVFTTKEKLDCHIDISHHDEIRSLPNLMQDESSNEMDVEEDEEDSAINVKELDDHMVVEIKKTSDYLIPNVQEESEEKLDNTNSEESDSDMLLPDLTTALAMSSKNTGKESAEISIATVGGATITKTVTTPKKDDKIRISDNQTASILRKAEEVKKKVIPQVASEPITDKKTNIRTENNSAGTSDKSLRMLEKDLQELKRTHPRSEVAKTPVKPLETLRSRRAQIHTSTPKPRTPTDDRKIQIMSRSPIPEKKLPERRIVTKENKEPKESNAKSNNGNGKEEKLTKEKEAKEKEAKEKETKEKEAKEKEAKEKEAMEKERKEKEAKEKETKEKEAKEKERKEKEAKEKEVKQKEVKEKETPKNIVKNGNDKSSSEEGIRRSTRPSKIKDYAKMIRDRSQDSDEENDDSDDADDEEYKEIEKPVEPKPRARRASIKTPAPKATPSPATPAPRKRGRPRKEAVAVAAKVRKEELEDNEDDDSESEKEKPKTPVVVEKQKENKNTPEASEANKPAVEQKPPSTLVSPTGQTLKKIPVRALPPGVKPMPLPVNARTVGREICEMQIGKKVVKVQKIVMTKAEVEAMAKKGMVEMKDGTMVLKPGVKIPTSDASVLKTSLVGEDKESPSKKIATPSRCDFGDDA